jgi:hypothetical protein
VKPVTAETITSRQINSLRRGASSELLRNIGAADRDVTSFTSKAGAEVIRAARQVCADAYNARQAAKGGAS